MLNPSLDPNANSTANHNKKTPDSPEGKTKYTLIKFTYHYQLISIPKRMKQRKINRDRSKIFNRKVQ